ncbi:putative polysaccharide biosynthesis protein [Levilactobacillus humaensis]|uniref:putative polysaccharide biosynthesis protein n=1 Tax=Levilactobacillus humaensis TaxID=2950375 RepID=UPI0021C42B82|nr:polysaccharide biosynthesis protein [Levilactobacillus humaensis]
MGNRNVNTAMQGALILSISAFIAKLLSAVYRVPFQNMVGNTGFYVYQQVYPIYGIGMTFALSGLPVFISKLVAEAPDLASQQQVARQVERWLWVVALGIFGFLMLAATALARGMGDPQLAPLIRVVAAMFLFMPALSVNRGYHQGRFQMLPTARSQVVEQLVRVVVILTAAAWATHQQWSVYTMGAWALSGGTIAALAALLVLPQWRQRDVEPRRPIPHVGRRLLVEGGTLCLLTAMLVLLQLVDSFTVMKGLVAGGMSADAAKSLKGVYDRAQPLVQLGLVVAVAFATSLLPALTATRRREHPQTFKRLTTTMMRIAMMIAVAATAGLMGLMPWINRLLFGDTQGSTMLAVYMLSIVLATLIQTYNSVLQSQDQYRLTVVALLAGLAVKIIGNGWLVRESGAIGASWLTVISLLVILGIVWWGSERDLRAGIWRGAFLPKLAGITAIMVFGVRLAMTILERWWPAIGTGRLAAGGGLLIGIPVGVALFLGLAIWWHLLSIREWLAIPHAKSMLRLWQQLKRHGGN